MPYEKAQRDGWIAPSDFKTPYFKQLRSVLDVKKLNAGAGALAANWCYGKAAFGNKDHGTPGTANTTCP